MSTIEDEARARLEEQLSRVEHYGRQLGNAPVKRATFNVDDVRTLLAASRREPSEPEYVGNERDVLGEDERVHLRPARG